HFRFERMNNILIAAMLQSEQAWLPVLHEPQSFQIIITSFAYKQKLIAHCENDAEKNNIVSAIIESETQILIGPEGDFTLEEIKQALENNYVQVSLGITRLRSETAGVVAATLVMNR
ncbi:MAG TPA: RsmE family RNA methyltransferase, partial [Chitinophagaceae bacterium]|nr:RsmE family RNA methyltransferase [Chitinophagaceae bacterium]